MRRVGLNQNEAFRYLEALNAWLSDDIDWTKVVPCLNKTDPKIAGTIPVRQHYSGHLQTFYREAGGSGWALLVLLGSGLPSLRTFHVSAESRPSFPHLLQKKVGSIWQVDSVMPCERNVRLTGSGGMAPSIQSAVCSLRLSWATMINKAPSEIPVHYVLLLDIAYPDIRITIEVGAIELSFM